MAVFQFKKFAVEQEGATMKINTDGVLLAAFCRSKISVKNILDIGTGTGVIALMLAQKFTSAQITAIDIDKKTVQLAQKNFSNAPFSSRMEALCQNFLTYQPKLLFDLLISNPPYFIDALKNDNIRRRNARHVNTTFFETFFKNAHTISSQKAEFWLIIPSLQLNKIIAIAKTNNWFPLHYIQIWNFENGQCIRHIAVFSKQLPSKVTTEIFHIRNGIQQYSDAYQKILSPYFL